MGLATVALPMQWLRAFLGWSSASQPEEAVRQELSAQVATRIARARAQRQSALPQRGDTRVVPLRSDWLKLEVFVLTLARLDDAQRRAAWLSRDDLIIRLMIDESSETLPATASALFAEMDAVIKAVKTALMALSDGVESLFVPSVLVVEWPVELARMYSDMIARLAALHAHPGELQLAEAFLSIGYSRPSSRGAFTPQVWLNFAAHYRQGEFSRRARDLCLGAARLKGDGSIFTTPDDDRPCVIRRAGDQLSVDLQPVPMKPPVELLVTKFVPFWNVFTRSLTEHTLVE